MFCVDKFTFSYIGYFGGVVFNRKEPYVRANISSGGGECFAQLPIPYFDSLECTGKPYLLKAQHSAFNISDSTTIPITVQNWQITSFVPDSTDLVVDSSNKCLAVRTVGMQRCPGFHKNVSFAK